MKTLLINGSPRSNNSNTLKLAHAFIRGLEQAGSLELQSLDLAQLRIKPCQGCYACWTTSPGICVIDDDMQAASELLTNAECVIWCAPLYTYGLPSTLKAFRDRLLPQVYPWILQDENGWYRHPYRHDKAEQKQVLISTCGFCSIENNYESVLKMFELALKKPIPAILCPEGELLNVPAFAEQVRVYLEKVQGAGRDFGLTGAITSDLQQELSIPLLAAEQFIQVANANWEVADGSSLQSYLESLNPADAAIQSKPAKQLPPRLLRQMAALYQPYHYKQDIVLEFQFTDTGETWQMLLGESQCCVDAATLPYTTRIETPFSTWLEISEGKLNGVQAMMQGKYKVLGDFSTMQNMSHYFGGKTPEDPRPESGKSSMLIMLLPWLVLWNSLPFSLWYGALAAMLSAALVAILGWHNRLTVYDGLSALLVSCLGAAALSGFNLPQILPLSYLMFGLLWLLSCLRPVPLSAHYSMHNFGGKSALSNPLFIKTNRILCLAWGSLYLLMAAYSALLFKTMPFARLALLNLAPPLAMSLFTVWFIRWYPASVARKGLRA